MASIRAVPGASISFCILPSHLFVFFKMLPLQEKLFRFCSGFMVPLSSTLGSETSPTRNMITPTYNTSSEASNILDQTDYKQQPIRNGSEAPQPITTNNCDEQPIKTNHFEGEPMRSEKNSCDCLTNNSVSNESEDTTLAANGDMKMSELEKKEKECLSDILRSDRTSDIILV